MKKNNAGVIGAGEVGNAIAEILSAKFAVYKKDISFNEIENNRIDFLHICFPFNENFISQVVKEINLYKPKLTIIHSTIAVGTSRKIFNKTKLPVVHSPILGRHTDMVPDIMVFTKFVGGVDKESAILAKKHLESLNLKVELMGSSEETELAKLLDTTYYGWNIIFCKLVGNLCHELNLDFENVYTRFNQVYNQGYSKSLPNVTRPVLKYSHQRDVNGGIGGHCVIENAQILDDLYKLPITQFLVKEDKKIKGLNKKK